MILNNVKKKKKAKQLRTIIKLDLTYKKIIFNEKI